VTKFGAALLMACLVLAIVALGRPVLALTASPSRSADLPYGITITGVQFTRTAPGPGGASTAPADFRNLGVAWARVQIHMSELFPTNPASLDPSVVGNYNWSLLDQALLAAQSVSQLVDYPLQGVPNLSYNGHAFQNSCGDPTTYVLNAYVAALMSHLRNDLFVQHPEAQGTLRAIEIGNEDWSFSPNGQPCENRPKVYARVVESVAPSIRNLGAFMTPPPLIGTMGYTNFGKVDDSTPAHSVKAFWNGFYGFRANPKDRGPAPLIDFANFHYYHDNVSPDIAIAPKDPTHPTHPHGQDTFKTVYQAIQTAGADSLNHDGQPMPIWVTETGWTLSGCNQNASFIVTPSQQSSYEQAMLEESRLSKRAISHLFLYTADSYSSSCGYNGMDISNDGFWEPAAAMLNGFIKSYPTW